MKINQVLVESAGATVAFAFGRFNPAHQGHVEVWRTVEQAGANWFIGTNSSTLGPNDPLTFQQKSAWMTEIYPAIAGHIVAEQSVLTLAAYIFKKTRKNERATVAYITDAADWAWSGKLLNQYNGVEGAHGYYKFAQITHVPSPRVSSATALREAARADDKVAFYHASGTDPKSKVAGLTYFDTVKQAVEKYPLPVKKVKKVKEQGVAEDNLKEFAPGSGGGESGRWYTDNQMTDLVGDGWWNDLDISGEVSKQEMIQEAQAWLDDQGYSVHVLNCKVNDDDMEWFIEGSFQNSGFAKKGMAEGQDNNEIGSGWKTEHGIVDRVEGNSVIVNTSKGKMRVNMHDIKTAEAPEQGVAEEEQKTVAKTWDQMTSQEKSSGVKGRTVWNEKTQRYYTVFDVPAKEVDEASLATMRDYFAGDENAQDPTISTTQRNWFDKNKDKNGRPTVDKRFRSPEQFRLWLKQNKLRQISGVQEDDESSEVKQ